MTTYASISNDMKSTKMFNSEGKKALKENCKEFGVIYPKMFNKITPKVDDVTHTVPKMIDMWGTIGGGGLREEDSEVIHHSQNVVLRDLVCVRDHGKRMTSAIQRVSIAQSTDKNLWKPEARKFRCRPCLKNKKLVYLTENKCEICGWERENSD